MPLEGPAAAYFEGCLAAESAAATPLCPSGVPAGLTSLK